MAFIENDAEKIIGDLIRFYESKVGYTLNAADVERVMFDVMTYREILLRAEIEKIMNQNFVQTATAFGLDYWGELFGIIRNENEEDKSYRARILFTNSGGGKGAYDIYRLAGLSVEGVVDVQLFSRFTDEAVPAGVINIVPLAKVDGKGSVPDVNLKEAILNKIKNTKTAIIGDRFVLENPIAVSVNGTIEVKKKLTANTQTFLNDLNVQINNYFNALSLKFVSDFSTIDLEKEIIKTPNLNSVISLSFPNVPIKENRHFYVKGNVTINLV